MLAGKPLLTAELPIHKIKCIFSSAVLRTSCTCIGLHEVRSTALRICIKVTLRQVWLSTWTAWEFYQFVHVLYMMHKLTISVIRSPELLTKFRRLVTYSTFYYLIRTCCAPGISRMDHWTWDWSSFGVVR